MHGPGDECGAPRAARVRGTLASSPALRLAGFAAQGCVQAMWRGQGVASDHFGGGAPLTSACSYAQRRRGLVAGTERSRSKQGGHRRKTKTETLWLDKPFAQTSGESQYKLELLPARKKN